MPMSQTGVRQRERERERERNPRSHFPGKKRSEKKIRKASRPHPPPLRNPAHSRNSIIQLSFPAKTYAGIRQLGPFWPGERATRSRRRRRRVERERERERRTWPTPAVVMAMCLRGRLCRRVRCQDSSSVSARHTLPPSSLRLSLCFFLAWTQPQIQSGLKDSTFKSNPSTHTHTHAHTHTHTKRVYVNNLVFQDGTVRLGS